MNYKLRTVNCSWETAREHVAELIGAPSRDVIFTSCATEGNNATAAALNSD
jgi:cysteine sulfinate desulfinase/cysteine desulfurase-like protein